MSTLAGLTTDGREQLVAEIAREVVLRLRSAGAPAKAPSPATPAAAALGDGVFATVDAAVEAAARAQRRVQAMSLEERGRAIAVIRRLCDEQAPELARRELDETGIGRLDHKIEKLQAVKRVLGVEALRIEARSDASGLCVIERAPWGVVGMVLPATHSAPTLASNAINVIAAGNAAVFSPHPAAWRVAAHVLQLFNRGIERETGVKDALTTVAEPSIASAEALFEHPGVALLCVTGGPAVVRAAMRTGKRVIAAGPGNPPVVVDETACPTAAAAAIIEGAAFDNNLLCIGEKEVFVLESVADQLMAELEKAGAVRLNSAQLDRLTKEAFTFKEGHGAGCPEPVINKTLIGKDASVLAKAAGVSVPEKTDLLFAETDKNHVFVQEEQMMPFIPIVRVKSVEEGIKASLAAEHNYKHTSIIHSHDVEHMTAMARALDTTLFIKNGPCSAGLGLGGEGYLSYSIATPTGEGVTNPRTFTRVRRCVMVDNLRIY